MAFRCGYCGRTFYQDTMKCPHCRTPFSGTSYHRREPVTIPWRPLLVIALVIAAVWSGIHYRFELQRLLNDVAKRNELDIPQLLVHLWLVALILIVGIVHFVRSANSSGRSQNIGPRIAGIIGLMSTFCVLLLLSSKNIMNAYVLAAVSIVAFLFYVGWEAEWS